MRECVKRRPCQSAKVGSPCDTQLPWEFTFSSNASGNNRAASACRSRPDLGWQPDVDDAPFTEEPHATGGKDGPGVPPAIQGRRRRVVQLADDMSLCQKHLPLPHPGNRIPQPTGDTRHQCEDRAETELEPAAADERRDGHEGPQAGFRATADQWLDDTAESGDPISVKHLSVKHSVGVFSSALARTRFPRATTAPLPKWHSASGFVPSRSPRAKGYFCNVLPGSGLPLDPRAWHTPCF